MIAKPTALVIGIFALTFITVSLVADLLSPGGFNAGRSIGGLYENKDCKCEYSVDYDDYMCSSDCGDMANTYCKTIDDCLV